MMTVYLIIIVVLFLLAISDLVVGVSNDAVNFLNSAVGAKAASFRTILIVAALGIILGCTFSSGMMEVARKGIFHPELFYFSEIIILFLAVMVTDVILLDSFNTFGMPTSTTVSIVFELLGAAVALSIIKIYTDPNAQELGSYINSAKALAIISGILLSVIVAFTAGVIVQYLTRLLFSFDYDRRLKMFGPLWGGLAIAAITYFILIKGVKGASFMDDNLKSMVKDNAFLIISGSFVVWTLLLQLLTWFTKVNILKMIVLIGTFALAMAFASNDLVNFIGVPLAGYNSYELYAASGGAADEFLMTGLAGKVPTPTLLLLFAGLIMTVTLWTSKKAKRVIKTSLDLGRQYEGSERFASYAVSRSLVRSFSRMATFVNNQLPTSLKQSVEKQFDERPFIQKQANLGAEAPSFDMIRAASTLVVASILISIGTALKLPLSTTYVTFMVFMGTSLADGAWGRESAVYRVSGVLSVIGGWFFTAFSAFTVAFIVVGVFYFGGIVAIAIVIAVAAFFIFRSHKLTEKRLEEQIEFEKSLQEDTLTKTRVIELSLKQLTFFLGKFGSHLDETFVGLGEESLSKLSNTNRKFQKVEDNIRRLKMQTHKALDKIDEDEIEAGHVYILVADYLFEMSNHVKSVIKSSLNHIDNNHKTLLPVQIKELQELNTRLKDILISTINVFKSMDQNTSDEFLGLISGFIKQVRSVRKKQLKRVKNREIGTRISMLCLNHMAEMRNLVLFSNRIVRVCQDLLMSDLDEQRDDGDIEVMIENLDLKQTKDQEKKPKEQDKKPKEQDKKSKDSDKKTKE